MGLPDNQSLFTLVNPQNGNLAFKFVSFEDGRYFDHVQRNNYYSLIWITEGEGTVKADFAEYAFEKNNLFAFSPYQPFMFSPYQPFMFSAEVIKGTAIYFHPDFFCIHHHQTETGCNGVLFNNIYQPHCTYINEISASSLNIIIDQIKNEMKNRGSALAQHEILISYLKIFLITTSRLKSEQEPETMVAVSDLEKPFILQSLKEFIEKDFKKKHSPSDYAEALNISQKALAKITKSYFNKTLTELISERIIIEAKRELYLTKKTIKEIAYELGYDDEHYFSRFFKTNAEISPQIYRETVGFGRDENYQ